MGNDWNFKNVFAKEYRLDLERDAFINDLASLLTNQKLLESNELKISEALNKTRLLRLAEKYFSTYASRNNLITASFARVKNKSP